MLLAKSMARLSEAPGTRRANSGDRDREIKRGRIVRSHRPDLPSALEGIAQTNAA